MYHKKWNVVFLRSQDNHDELDHLNTFASYSHELCPVTPVVRPVSCKTSTSKYQPWPDVLAAVPLRIDPCPMKWSIRGKTDGHNMGISNCGSVFSPIPRKLPKFGPHASGISWIIHCKKPENRLFFFFFFFYFIEICGSHRTEKLQTSWSQRIWCIALDQTSQHYITWAQY